MSNSVYFPVQTGDLSSMGMEEVPLVKDVSMIPRLVMEAI